MKLEDDFIIEVSYSESDSAIKMKVIACRQVTIYELAEALYDYTSNKSTDLSYDIEFCTFDGKKVYHFTDNSLWINQTTVLSDISRQIQI